MTLATTILALVGAALVALGHPKPEKWQQGRRLFIGAFWLGMAMIVGALGVGIWEIL
jgi:hypothetical protein